MSSHVILLLGTPRGHWREHAKLLLPDLTAEPCSGGPGGLCADAQQAQALLAAQASDARLLVFVEPPAHALATQDGLAGPAEQDAWAAQWQVESGRLLRLIQRHRAQCLVIDVDAARHDTAALAHELQRRLGRPIPADAAPMPARDDIALHLSQRALDDEPGLRRLYAELQACCDWPDLASAPSRSSAWDALASWRRTQADLAQLGSQLGDVRATESRLRAERDTLSARLASQDQAVARLSAEQAQSAEHVLATQADAARRMAATQAEAAQLVAAARAEAARLVAGAQAETAQRIAAVQAEGAAQAAHTAQTLQAAAAAREQALEAEVERSLVQSQAIQEALEAALSARGEIEARHRALERERGDADGRQRALEHERDGLQAQCHATQEALEQSLTRLREAEAVKANQPAAVPAAGPVCIAELRPSRPRDERPYREITWMLRQIEAPGRSVPGAEVRLVEHHGRPGLVVMGPAAGQPLLQGWQETGREDNLPYMLLIPGDAAGAVLLAALDSSDWLTLLGVAEHIERAASAAAPKLKDLWWPLARRLVTQLRELPPVWRHGPVQVWEEHHGGEPAWRVEVGQVHHGLRHLPKLTVLWQPTGRAAGLAISHPHGSDEPLVIWPQDGHGDAADHLWLPLGSHDADAAAWLNLTPADRDFALRIAAELPRMLARLETSALPSSADDTWRRAADALAGEAVRRLASGGLPPPSLVRRLARSARQALGRR